MSYRCHRYLGSGLELKTVYDLILLLYSIFALWNFHWSAMLNDWRSPLIWESDLQKGKTFIGSADTEQYYNSDFYWYFYLYFIFYFILLPTNSFSDFKETNGFRNKCNKLLRSIYLTVSNKTHIKGHYDSWKYEQSICRCTVKWKML